MASPPHTSVLSVERTVSGLRRLATDGLRKAHVARNVAIAFPRSWRRSSSPGTHTHAPMVSGVRTSMRATSNVSEAKLKTRDEASMCVALAYARELLQKSRWATTTPFGRPVLPDVKSTYAVLSGLGFVEAKDASGGHKGRFRTLSPSTKTCVSTMPSKREACSGLQMMRAGMIDSSMSFCRDKGWAGSRGTKAPPAKRMPIKLTTAHEERVRQTGTRVSGPTPSCLRRNAYREA